eukprot:GHVQ01016645.1.p1 GENE.GHVQ01016645.1~~GHVQ01016645.1.p1  ORF type:complete len:688 (+),score=102.55 GHVQ01016645.1:128-2191(+)
MHVEEGIIEGFKSYSSKQVVGSFHPQFNAITGRNGTGKSNILDAICFALGLQNLELIRARRMQELVFKQGACGVSKATVTIVFNNQSRPSPISQPEYKDLDRISLTRQYAMGGRQKYLINNRNSRVSQVAEFLHSLRLNVNNPQFLIMQGRVTKVTKMQPTEILGLLEEAAETRLCGLENSEALKTVEKKDNQINRIKVMQSDLQRIADKRRQEKEDYINFAHIENEIEKLEKLHAAGTYMEYRKRLQEEEQRLRSSTEDSSHTQIRIIEVKEELRVLSERRQKLLDECSLTSGLSQLRIERDRLDKELTGLLCIVKDKSATVEETKHRLSSLAKKVQILEEKEATTKDENADERRSMETAEEALRDARNELDRAETQLTTMITGCANIAETTGSLREELKVARSRHSELESVIYTNKNTHKNLLDELNDTKAACSNVAQEWQEALAEADILSQQVDELERQVEALGYNPQDNEKLNSDFDTTSQEYDGLLHRLQCAQHSVHHRCVQYQTPPHLRDQVFGHLFELFKIRDDRLPCATALQIIGGAKLSYIVVDNKETSRQLMHHNNFAHGSRRVTILPFRDIKVPFVVPRQKLEDARRVVGSSPTDDSRVLYGVDLVEYDSQMRKAMDYCYGQTLLCSQADIARKVTYQSGLRLSTCTLQGDQFTAAGAMHGGAARQDDNLVLLHRV